MSLPPSPGIATRKARNPVVTIRLPNNTTLGKNKLTIELPPSPSHSPAIGHFTLGHHAGPGVLQAAPPPAADSSVSPTGRRPPSVLFSTSPLVRQRSQSVGTDEEGASPGWAAAIRALNGSPDDDNPLLAASLRTFERESRHRASVSNRSSTSPDNSSSSSPTPAPLSSSPSPTERTSRVKRPGKSKLVSASTKKRLPKKRPHTLLGPASHQGIAQHQGIVSHPASVSNPILPHASGLQEMATTHHPRPSLVVRLADGNGTEEDRQSLFKGILVETENDCSEFNCLYLNYFNLSRKHLKRLREALLHNSHIQKIDLRHTAVRNVADLEVLWSGIDPATSGLRELDLRTVELNPRAIRLLEDMLRTHFFITSVLVDERVEGVEAILAANREIGAYCSRMADSSTLSLHSRGVCSDSLFRRVALFPHLLHIDLSDNVLSTLPQLDLPLLQTLLLDRNQLTSLPASIGSLPSLLKLSVSHNKLAGLPIGVSLLLRLEHLDVSHNKLTELPLFPAHMQSLKTLKLHENRISVFASRFAAGLCDAELIQAIKEYAHETVAQYRSRLVLVGAPQSGKSTLAASLLSSAKRSTTASSGSAIDQTYALSSSKRPASLNPTDLGLSAPLLDDHQPDHLIKVDRWEVKIPSSLLPATTLGVDSFHYDIWDFDGDAAFQATQQIFISSQAVYLVVFNMVEAIQNRASAYQANGSLIHISEVAYWVRLLNHRAPNAPILLVGTHGDDRACSSAAVSQIFSDLQQVLNSLDNVQSMFLVNNSSKKELHSLITELLKLSLQEDFALRSIPRKYLSIEEDLKAMRHRTPILTWSDLSKIASRHHFSSGDLPDLVSYLRIISGSILYFEQVNKDLVILNPQWFANAFALLVSLRSPEVPEEERLPSLVKPPASLVKPPASYRPGILAIDSLPSVWAEAAYPLRYHTYLIQILVTFEVIYEFETSKIFVPSLLSASRRTTHDISSKRGMLKHSRSREAIHAFSVSKPSGSPVQSPSPTKSPGPNIRPLISSPSWSEGINSSSLHLVGRLYDFDFIPMGFFSRIIVRFLHSLEFNMVDYWKNGILLEKDAARVLLILHHRTSLRLFVRAQDPGKHLHSMVDNITTLIEESGNLTVRTFVPCSHCMHKHGAMDFDRLFIFSERELQVAIADRQTTVMCARSRLTGADSSLEPVLVADLAPDLALQDMRGCKIKYEDIKILNKIGEGAFADVYSGIWRGETVAVKQCKLATHLPVDPMEDNPEQIEEDAQAQLCKEFEEFRREALLISSLQHKNIVDIKGVVFDPFCIVLEFMPLGTLYEFVYEEANIIDFDLKTALCIDVARAMDFIHQNHLIHRDLKSPNILLTKTRVASGSERIVAKVADFGLSRKLLLSPALSDRVVDNPTWLAPEIIKREKYTNKADVYSFGVIMWELLVRQKPWPESLFMWEIQEAVVAGERPEIPESCRAEYRDLIMQSWDGNPDNRPSFSELVTSLSAILESFVSNLEVVESESATTRKLNQLRAVSALPKIPRKAVPKGGPSISVLHSRPWLLSLSSSQNLMSAIGHGPVTPRPVGRGLTMGASSSLMRAPLTIQMPSSSRLLAGSGRGSSGDAPPFGRTISGNSVTEHLAPKATTSPAPSPTKPSRRSLGKSGSHIRKAGSSGGSTTRRRKKIVESSSNRAGSDFSISPSSPDPAAESCSLPSLGPASPSSVGTDQELSRLICSLDSESELQFTSSPVASSPPSSLPAADVGTATANPPVAAEPLSPGSSSPGSSSPSCPGSTPRSSKAEDRLMALFQGPHDPSSSASPPVPLSQSDSGSTSSNQRLTALFDERRAPTGPPSACMSMRSNRGNSSSFLAALREGSPRMGVDLEALDPELSSRKFGSIGPKRFQALRSRWEVISTVNLRLAAGVDPTHLSPPPLEDEDHPAPQP